jgi:hypothetical protein
MIPEPSIDNWWNFCFPCCNFSFLWSYFFILLHNVFSTIHRQSINLDNFILGSRMMPLFTLAGNGGIHDLGTHSSILLLPKKRMCVHIGLQTPGCEFFSSLSQSTRWASVLCHKTSKIVLGPLDFFSFYLEIYKYKS